MVKDSAQDSHWTATVDADVAARREAILDAVTSDEQHGHCSGKSVDWVGSQK